MLHHTARYKDSDRFFVIGMNPDDSGGGVIGTAPTLTEANALRDQAIKENYSIVRVRTWRELVSEKSDEL